MGNAQARAANRVERAQEKCIVDIDTDVVGDDYIMTTLFDTDCVARKVGLKQ